MGGKIVVPEADLNISKVIKTFQLSPKDVSDFWKLFQKLDKEKTGLVPLAKIFQRFEMERTIFTDCLLDLLEIEHEGEINFSDFLVMITTYCFFEPREILLFCFYCFDQDKTGFVSVDDLNNLMNMVHNVQKGKTVTGTVKASWLRLQFKGEQLDFKELKKINDAFPRLFEPAFLLQQNMMIHTLGEIWWTRKKRSLQDLKDLNAEKMEQLKARKEARKQRKKNRKIQRNMGLLRYFLCPCLRKYYDPSLTEYDKLSEEQKQEMDKQMAIARRQVELKIKNPETAAWLKYQEKIENDLKQLEGGNTEESAGNVDGRQGDSPTSAEEKVVTTASNSPGKSFLQEKVVATARSREDRAILRSERKKQRLEETGIGDKKKNKKF